MAGTKFSDYLGQKHYKKSKKSKIHADLGFQTFVKFFEEKKVSLKLKNLKEIKF